MAKLFDRPDGLFFLFNKVPSHYFSKISYANVGLRGNVSFKMAECCCQAEASQHSLQLFLVSQTADEEPSQHLFDMR